MKSNIPIILLSIFTFKYCYSQNKDMKIKMKIDSLYPKAQILGHWGGLIPKSYEIELKCNCPEYNGEMGLTLDTNANILMKTYYFWSYKYMPDNILNYAREQLSSKTIFDTSYFEKHFDRIGNVTYTIIVTEDNTEYLIELKSTGEILSKKPKPIFRE
jgi:hypothetical protein